MSYEQDTALRNLTERVRRLELKEARNRPATGVTFSGGGGLSSGTIDDALVEHVTDTTDAHDASAVSIADAGGYFTGTDVEAALQELGGASIPPGTYVLTTEGGQETINARGALGATETVDPSNGNIVTGTLDQDCTITLAAPSGSGGSTLEWWLTQSGGSWTPTFSPTGGSFQWDGGVTPTFPASGQTFRIITERIPGTTNDWVGNMLGASGGTPATTVEDETTFGISPAVGTDTEYARQDHTHGTPANPVTPSALTALGVVGPILIADDHSTPLVFADLLQTEEGDDLLYADIGA